MTSSTITRIRQKQITELIASGKRLDGRGLTDYRPIQIDAGIIEKAEGSAMVSMSIFLMSLGVLPSNRLSSAR